MEEDRIFKISLVEPISIVNRTKEELDEEFTEELYYYIRSEDIINHRIAVVGEDTFYVRCTKERINELNYFFSKYHVVKISDVSEEFIKSNEIYNSINEKDMLQFGQLFDDYRLLHTTKDDVLDKILKFGVEYIDNIDKTILGEEDIED